MSQLIRSSIVLEHHGSLESLAKEVSSALSIPEFYYKSDPLPPHEVTATCECLGFEVWLLKLEQENCFELSFESTTVSEFMENKFINVSSWFSKYLEISGKFKIRNIN